MLKLDEKMAVRFERWLLRRPLNGGRLVVGTAKLCFFYYWEIIKCTIDFLTLFIIRN